MNTKLTTLVLFCFLFYNCNQVQPKTASYKASVTIDVAKQNFDVNAHIYYIPKPSNTSNTLALLLHENALLKQCTATNLLSYKEIATTNKQKRIILTFKEPVMHPVKILFEYTSTLKKEDAPWGIDQISNEWIELSLNSSWLPIIASYDNQFTAEAVIHIISDREFTVISSGTTEKTQANTFKIQNKIPQLDLVVVASPKFYTDSRNSISIYDHQKKTQRNEFIFSLGEKSYQWLNKNFGAAKKLPKAQLVITPRNESGYARKNFVVLSDDISVKDTLHFANYITHEFAHFWSSGADPLSAHRWLDESIAEYIAWKYIAQEDKDALQDFLSKIKNEAVTLPPVYNVGATNIPQHAVMYRKGVSKLFDLEQHIGEKAMFALLNKWFTYDTKDSEKFLILLQEMHGEKIAQAFRNQLSQ